jgi:hypothetical protein
VKAHKRILVLSLAATALCAWWLGGSTGAGVLGGGLSGLLLGAAVTGAERRLFAARPERGFGGLVLGFAAKLAALAAAALLFHALRPAGIDAQAFLLAFFAAVLLATAATWIGSRPGTPEAA